MIFLDTNVFLRYLVEPDSAANHARQEIAATLFDAADRGEVKVTTSEAVLAEVAFILSSKRQYGLGADEVATILAPIIRSPGLSLPRGQKRRYLRALEIWSENPRLGFVDALTASSVENTDTRLATFDRDFNRFTGILRWEPPRANSNGH